MKLNLHVMDFSDPAFRADVPGTLDAVARAADEGGWSTLTMMDHYFQMERYAPPQDPMLEGYTSLGYLAGRTERLQLGLLVTGVTYRHPGLLAKIVTTLDVLSRGRALLGIGAAWYEREHLGLGVPFPPVVERFERLEEAIQIVLQMWSDDDGPYNGRWYQLAETICEPRPQTRPRPPVLIGGSGERKTLRLVAQYADACNLFATDRSEVEHKLAVLDGHCHDVGRDPASIERTMLAAGSDPAGDPDGFLTEMERYAKLGISAVWLSAPAVDPAAWVRRVSERVVGRLAEL